MQPEQKYAVPQIEKALYLSIREFKGREPLHPINERMYVRSYLGHQIWESIRAGERTYGREWVQHAGRKSMTAKYDRAHIETMMEELRLAASEGNDTRRGRLQKLPINDCVLDSTLNRLYPTQ